jgi:hypothetical protein
MVLIAGMAYSLAGQPEGICKAIPVWRAGHRRAAPAASDAERLCRMVIHSGRAGIV